MMPRSDKRAKIPDLLTEYSVFKDAKIRYVVLKYGLTGVRFIQKIQ